MSPTPLAILTTYLDSHPSTQFIRFVIHDYHNVSRCMLCTVSRAKSIASKPDENTLGGEPGIMYLGWNTGQFDPVPILQSGSDYFEPVWSTIHPTIRDDIAMVICRVRQPREIEKDHYSRDPRTVLERLVNKAKDDYGLEFTVGFEVEFQLLPSLDSERRVKSPMGVYVTTATREEPFHVVLDSVGMLETAGVEIWNFHPELGDGEYEIALSPCDAVKAVDDLIYTSDVVKSVARKYGVWATMHPQPIVGGLTLGQHIHLGLNDSSTSTPNSDSFLAGLLEHLRGITGILLGGKDSYGIRDGSIGGGNISWGQTKISPIRKCSDTHFEIRVPDALGNPYLQVASLIGAGLDGYQRGIPLEIKENKSIQKGVLDEETKRALGIKQVLPKSQEEALRAMRDDDEFLRGILGDMCFDTYLKHRELEGEKSGHMNRKERTRAIMETI